jgi:hypothetical protein
MKESWRKKDYIIGVYVCNARPKAHLFTAVAIDEGHMPKTMICFGKGCRCNATLKLPKDRPVPPFIPKPSIEWRRADGNKNLIPWPLTTKQDKWRKFK